MSHRWRFFRRGGVDQVELKTAADLLALRELDQKLWVALACPVGGLEIDERTLSLVDQDNDGRVRAPELIAAIEWAAGLLTDPDELVRNSASLKLERIDDQKPEGAQVLATARRLLEASGKADATEIFAADVQGAIAEFNKQKNNGDGVVPEAAIDDADTRAALHDLLASVDTPVSDRNGEPGVDGALLESFFEGVRIYLAWHEAGQAEPILPLGDATAGAYAAFAAVKSKVDDFFARARVAAYDPRTLAGVNREEADYLSLLSKELDLSAQSLAEFPLAHVAPGRPLPLAQGINPAWVDAVGAFHDKVVAPLLGERLLLDESEWKSIRSRFAAHEKWLAEKPAVAAAKLSPERAKALLDTGVQAKLREAIERDEAEKPNAAALSLVEKLVLFNRDLILLANNFVSFRDFYDPERMAIFQYGRLFIDQRECQLVLQVFDSVKHAALGGMSKCCLVYCDIKNEKGEKRQIVAAVTNGDTDNLMVGRNAVFYDRDGNDWDATVTKFIDNPVSVREAFWTPYKKFLRAIEDMVAKRAAEADAEADKRIAGAAAATGDAAKGAPSASTPLVPTKKIDVGMVAALGVAVGGITAALGALLQAFFGLGIWMPLGLLGLVLVISGPSMAVAWLKLRQRNLGPLLDANGWAINVQAKVNVPLGESLSKVPRLPAGARRDLHDPYAEKRRSWTVRILLLALVALGIGWYLGKLDTYLPPSVRSTEVLGDAAPANVKLVEPEPASPEGATPAAPKP